MQIDVIIPAAGIGSRFGGETNKIERELLGRPVFMRSIELFHGRPEVGKIILAVNPDETESFRFKWGERLALFGIEVVPGGRAERWETVLRALDHVGEGCTHVATHDAARPLTSEALIDRTFEAAKRYDAVIPGLPVSATLKRVEAVEPDPGDADPLDAILGDAGKSTIEVQRVVKTVDRDSLVEVQTPQVMTVELIRRAYAAVGEGCKATDDAGLVEALGESVYVVDGEATNLKITRPADFELAAAILEYRQAGAAKHEARKRLFVDDDED